MDETKINRLKEIIKESDNIVFFGGAGVSTESGIPDFRSATGIYFEKGRYNPEEVVSRDFFLRHTEYFYDFFFNKMVYQSACPNACHKKLVELEKSGKLKAIITQNIDGLHQKAGSKNVIELHGNVNSYYCTKCFQKYSIDDIIEERPIPHCKKCGAILHPDVVLYGEGLDQQNIMDAIDYIMKADCLIIGGTSLIVNPAASLIRYFRGKHLILINKTKTNADYLCELVINDPIGEVFSKL